MTDIERKTVDRVGEKLPSRPDAYTDSWAEAARTAYPEYEPGKKKPEALVVFATTFQAEQLNLPVLEIGADAPKALVDPALKKVEQITTLLKSEDFDEREKGSLQLREFLRTELKGKKPTPALERIFQLAGADDDPEVKQRVIRELKPLVTEAVNADVLELITKLAVIADNKKNTELAAGIRAVVEPIDQKLLFGKFVTDVIGPIRQRASDDFKKAYFDQSLSELDDKRRDEVIKKFLVQTKTSIKDADEAQNHEMAALARVLYNPVTSTPLTGSEPADEILGLPYRERSSAGFRLISIAHQLKDANKDPATVDLLQATAIEYYKESLIMAPDAEHLKAVRRRWADLNWLDILRNLNPDQFDRVLPDKLLPRTFDRD